MSTESGPRGPIVTASGAIASNPLPAGGPQVPLPTDKELVLKVVPMPADCNANGDIFGGWVMSHVDMAGAITAFKLSRGRTATVAVKEFIFKQPVRVGDILSFYSSILHIGNTSMTLKVEVYAERFDAQGSYLKVTDATVTYVAIDQNGRPRPVRPQSAADETMPPQA